MKNQGDRQRDINNKPFQIKSLTIKLHQFTPNFFFRPIVEARKYAVPFST
jgi:hypothetical protein